MRSRLIFLLCLTLFASSCVSKKKYLALEQVRDGLEMQNIRQYKTIDTLKAELQQKESEIVRLQRDTARLHNRLRSSREELEKAHNYLSSSKKELNERIMELQSRDTAIHTCKKLVQSYTDTLEILKKEALFQMGLLIEDDSSYMEVTVSIVDRGLQFDIPENFFFTPNNRNFISNKGKEMLKTATELYQKYPTVRITVTAPVHNEASVTAMKELADRESLRTSAICRALLTEHQIPAGNLQSGLQIETEETARNGSRILLRFTLDTTPIIEEIKKL
ncbi:MAG: hypothetical protein J6X35_01790 [Bacteroidales bacterium]|nr:hypothetical protein [Bacteroidales bacterium]MBP5612863.1 hypothetical protein [Bacteroidales bacterium]